MKDDILEVTISTEESLDSKLEASDIKAELLFTESGSTIVHLTSDTQKSICVCDPVIDSKPLVVPVSYTHLDVYKRQPLLWKKK